MTLSAKKSKVVKAIEEVTIKCCRHKYVVTEIKSISIINNNNNKRHCKILSFNIAAFSFVFFETRFLLLISRAFSSVSPAFFARVFGDVSQFSLYHTLRRFRRTRETSSSEI